MFQSMSRRAGSTGAIAFFFVFQAFCAWLAQAEELRVPLSRDLWVSTVGEEAFGNNGASPRLKLKSIQEFPLIDFDSVPLRGRVIRKAQLKLKLADNQLDRITISTVTHPWTEGKGSSYEKVPGLLASRFHATRMSTGVAAT